jgi:hypothetical protein
MNVKEVEIVDCDMLFSDQQAKVASGERGRLLSANAALPSVASAAKVSTTQPRLTELSCDARQSNERIEIEAKEPFLPPKVDENMTKNEGLEADIDMMQLQWYFRQNLSTIAHLTEQNSLLTQRVAILEAENEEMGDEMDYLIREIIHLRVEQRGAKCHMIKEVDTSGGIGSVMFESLSEEGDHDYHSYDDNSDDDVKSDIF